MASATQIGLAAAIQGRETQYPILASALENAASAYGTKVEWIFGDEPTRWFNRTQIVRTSFGATALYFGASNFGANEAWSSFCDRQLARHLEEIERTLLDGHLEERTIWRVVDGELVCNRYTTAGGARFYLEREPEVGDHLSLRILRDTVFLDRTAPDIDGRSAEYLTELTLVVIPKESI